MTTSPVLILATTAAVCSAAVGGLFYAFSTFVMRGLDRTEPTDAITAMRGINAEAQGNAPVLLVPPPLRAVLSRFLRHHLPQLGVLSNAEIPDERVVRVTALIGGSGE